MKKVSLDTIKSTSSVSDLLSNPFVYQFEFDRLFGLNDYVRSFDDEVLGFSGAIPVYAWVDDIMQTFSPFRSECSSDNHQDLHLLAKNALRAIAESLSHCFSPGIRLEMPEELALDDISCYQHDCGKIIKMEIDYEKNSIEFSLYD